MEWSLTHPENASLIASLLGVPELYIPGDDDRNKQLREISELIQGQPIPQGMPPGMMGEGMGGGPAWTDWWTSSQYG